MSRVPFERSSSPSDQTPGSSLKRLRSPRIKHSAPRSNTRLQRTLGVYSSPFSAFECAPSRLSSSFPLRPSPRILGRTAVSSSERAKRIRPRPFLRLIGPS
eukprot:254747-Prorocentrum_minimum.AAC.1